MRAMIFPPASIDRNQFMVRSVSSRFHFEPRCNSTELKTHAKPNLAMQIAEKQCQIRNHFPVARRLGIRQKASSRRKAGAISSADRSTDTVGQCWFTALEQ
jgi:hypothetical protein